MVTLPGTQSPRYFRQWYRPDWAVVPSVVNAANGGTARARSSSSIKWSYRPDWAVVLPNIRLQVVVPLNNGGGIVSTPKSRDVTLFGSNSEAIGAYKYPTLFYMKGHESINIILNSWGVSIVKV